MASWCLTPKDVVKTGGIVEDRERRLLKAPAVSVFPLIPGSIDREAIMSSIIVGTGQDRRK